MPGSSWTSHEIVYDQWDVISDMKKKKKVIGFNGLKRKIRSHSISAIYLLILCLLISSSFYVCAHTICLSYLVRSVRNNSMFCWLTSRRMSLCTTHGQSWEVVQVLLVTLLYDLCCYNSLLSLVSFLLPSSYSEHLQLLD